MAHDRLDVYLGELRPLLNTAAAARGQKAAEYLRELVRADLLMQSLLKDRVREVALNLAAAVEPDERYDPKDDPREMRAVAELAALLGSQPAAEGIAEALATIWTRWQLGQEE